MKIYTVLISFAAIAMLFLGSDQVHGSNLSTTTTADADADDHRLLKSNGWCQTKCVRQYQACKRQCGGGGVKPEVKPQVHSSGQFQIGWDMFKGHNKGSKTVGSACHRGCKRHSASAYSENESLFACGGDSDTRNQRWASNDKTDCRIKIPYCRHHVDSAPCKWEIKEVCK